MLIAIIQLKETVMIKSNKKPKYMQLVENNRRLYEKKNLKYVKSNWIFYWRFLAYLEDIGYRPRTIQTYYEKVKIFLDWLGNKSIRKVKKENIVEYILHLKKSEKYKLYTLRKFKESIKYFFNFVMRYSGIKKNPVSNLPIKLYYKEPENMDFFTQDEIEMIVKKPLNFLEKIDKNDFNTTYSYNCTCYTYYLHYLILKIMFSTGIRPCELINIEIKDFYCKKLKLRIQPKGNQQYIQKDRFVFITKKTANELRKLLRLQKNIRNEKSKHKLFIHYKGWGMGNNYPNRILKYWASTCGIIRRLYAYMIRYTYCTRLVENGADIYSLKKLMGHKELAVTLKHYLKLTRNEIRREWKKFNPIKLQEGVI
jgi:integrase/recombinase XerC